MISILIPTIDARAEHLARCTAAYEATTEGIDYELVIVRNEPTCGAGWLLGLSKAQGDFIHFTCDDIEPRHGWWPVAIETTGRYAIPAPSVYGHGRMEDGSLYDWTPAGRSVLPFFSREQLDALGPLEALASLHYYSDDWLSHLARKADIGIVYRTDYAFDHSWAPEGRIYDLEPDRVRYEALVR